MWSFHLTVVHILILKILKVMVNYSVKSYLQINNNNNNNFNSNILVRFFRNYLQTISNL